MNNNWLIKNAQIFKSSEFVKGSLFIQNGRIAEMPQQLPEDATVIDAEGLHLFPGFIDLHTHLREPGFGYKETIESGTMAAARGGYTTVCAMPNLKPVPDCLSHLQVEEEAIKKTARVHVLPYGAISCGEKGRNLAAMEEMASYVVAFTDDGVGLSDPNLMEEAMLRAKSLNKAIVAHAEDISLVQGGVIHDGAYAKNHGHKGNPSASEYVQVKRDLDLVRKTGAQYHVCHVSSKESVTALCQAQDEGLPVSFETAPHYLCLTDDDLEEDGRFRMNPPIREKADRDALRKALHDGRLLAIATDHAPHSLEEKSSGLDHALNGIVGLETAFPVCYTNLVLRGDFKLEELIPLFSGKAFDAFPLQNVKEARVGLPLGQGLEIGQSADLAIFDLNDRYTIDPKDFLSKGKSSPFSGQEVYGRCLLTLVGGQAEYRDEKRLNPYIKGVYHGTC